MDEDDQIRQDFEEMLEGLRDEIDSRGFSQRMKQALKLLLDGESYRFAAKHAGVGYREVFRNAKSVPELLVAHKICWVESWEDDFPAMWLHHLEDPQDEQPAG